MLPMKRHAFWACQTYKYMFLSGVDAMQHKITTTGNLQNKEGKLIEAGYATVLIRTYNPENISV